MGNEQHPASGVRQLRCSGHLVRYVASVLVMLLIGAAAIVNASPAAALFSSPPWCYDPSEAWCRCGATSADVRGDVTINGTAAWGGSYFSSGALIVTGSNSQLSVNAGGQTLIFGENTTATWLSDDELLKLYEGEMLAKIDRTGKCYELLEVQTPVANAGVRGTDYVVSVSEDGTTTVTVLDGEVDVSTRDGSDSVAVGTNERLLVTAAGLDEPASIDPAAIDRWWTVLVARLTGTATLQVTDPIDRSVGTIDGELVNEVPLASYTGPNDQLEAIVIPRPVDGTYDMTATATEPAGWYGGWYTLDVFAIGSNGAPHAEQWQLYLGSVGDQATRSVAVDAESEGDLIAPTTTLTVDPADPDGLAGWYLSPATVTLEAEDPGRSGVAVTGYLLDAGDWQIYTEPFTVATDGTTTIQARSIDLAGNVESPPVEATIRMDQTDPSVNVVVPSSDVAVQDQITLAAVAHDQTSGVADVTFSVREHDGATGSPVGSEALPATLNTTTGYFDYQFDTTALPDGAYLVVATATDHAGNAALSDVTPFSIRNWSVIELLPASEDNRAGRTMPVKFSLRVAAEVDPAQPFVYNEMLAVRIVDTADPVEPKQTSVFGDGAANYRIDVADEHYITNFRTERTPTDYTVEIWRLSGSDHLVGTFGFATHR
jgi:hypothetical protein